MRLIILATDNLVPREERGRGINGNGSKQVHFENPNTLTFYHSLSFSWVVAVHYVVISDKRGQY